MIHAHTAHCPANPTAVQARAGQTGTGLRWVLGMSMALMVLGMFVVVGGFAIG